MKINYYLKSVLTLVLFAASFFAFQAKADAVVIDGVAYDVLDATAKTAQVVALPGGEKYTGELTIAANVDMNGETYVVTKIGDNSLRESGDNAASENLTGITIPEGIEDIGNSAFANCSSITSIQLPASVNTIEDWAFYGCSNLASINIPDGVPAINAHTFQQSGLTSIDLPASVTALKGCAFQDCGSLATLNLSDGLTTIEAWALSGCSSLESLTIPNTVTDINDWAIEKTGLKEVYISWENPGDVNISYWTFGDSDSRFDVLRWKIPYSLADDYSDGKLIDCPVEQYVPAGYVIVVDGVAYKAADTEAKTAEVVALPDGEKYTGALTVAANVAFGSETYAVTKIGDNSLRESGDNAASENLTDVTIPEGVTDIGNSAFANCSSITSIQLPASVNTIEDWAFYGCGNLASINIPDGVTAINEHTFQQSGLTSIVLPASVTSLKVCAFQDSKLTSINLENITELVAWSLAGTALTSVVLPDGLTVIDGGTFSGCSALKTLTIPNSVTTINDWAIEKTGLKEIYISWENPEDLNISWWAFGDQEGRYSFVWNVPADLADVYGNTWKINDGTCPVVIDLSADTILYSGIAYQKLDEDAKTAQLVALPDGAKYTGALTVAANVVFAGESYAVTKIGDNSLRESGDNAASENLTGVTIPAGVEDIGNGAFADCSSITSIQLPASVNTIEDWAFNGCSNLASINIPNGITAINEHVFQNTALTSVALPASVTSLKTCAFQDAKSLATINLDNVTAVGDWALAGTAITSVNLANVTTIGTGAFNGSAITSPDVSNATSIGDWAFQNCTAMTSISLPDNLTAIGSGLFSGCSALETLTIPNSVTTIGSWALEKSGLKEIYVSWPNTSDVNIDGYAFGADAGKINFTWYVSADLADVYGTTWQGYPVYVIGGPDGMKNISGAAIKLANETGAIRIVSGSDLNGTVDVYSVNGVKLYTQDGQINNTTIALPAGVYVVRIASSEGIIIGKAVVK